MGQRVNKVNLRLYCNFDSIFNDFLHSTKSLVTYPPSDEDFLPRCHYFYFAPTTQ